jgi:transposase-like protein
MPKPDTANTQEVRPDPQLEKRTRRTFTVDYKLSILQQAAACKHGELGALLRREKLYSNQLAQWRREFENQGVKGLSKSLPGPAAAKTPEQRRIEQLEKENARLKKELRVKESCLELQKKALALIEQAEHEGLS